MHRTSERNSPRRGGDWSLCAPEFVPLPERVRGSVRVQYAGLLHELTKALERMFERDLSGINDSTRNQLAENLARRLCVVELFIALYRAGLRATADVLAVRNRLVEACAEADAHFCAIETAPAEGPAGARDVALRLLGQVQSQLGEATRLTLNCLDCANDVQAVHVEQIRDTLREASRHYAALLEHLGYEQDAGRLRKLTGTRKTRSEPSRPPTVPLPQVRNYAVALLERLEAE